MKRDDVLKTIKGAEECPGNAGVIKVPLEVFHQTAEALRNDPQSPMDFLRDIVGMDWGRRRSGGAVYFMESTATGEQIALRTATADRETPLLPTVSDLWKTALIKRTRGVRLLRHPLYGTSRHAPPVPARGLDRMAAPQGLRHELESAASGQRNQR